MVQHCPVCRTAVGQGTPASSAAEGKTGGEPFFGWSTCSPECARTMALTEAIGRLMAVTAGLPLGSV